MDGRHRGGQRALTAQGEAVAETGPLNLLILEDNPVIAWQLSEDLSALGHRVCGPFSTLDAARGWEGPLDGAIVDIAIGDDRSYAYVGGLLDRGVAVVFYSGLEVQPMAGGLERVPRCAKPAPTSQILDTLLKEWGQQRRQRRILAQIVGWRRMALEICGTQDLGDKLLEEVLEGAIRHYESCTGPREDPEILIRRELQNLWHLWNRARLA